MFEHGDGSPGPSCFLRDNAEGRINGLAAAGGSCGCWPALTVRRAVVPSIAVRALVAANPFAIPTAPNAIAVLKIIDKFTIDLKTGNAATTR